MMARRVASSSAPHAPISSMVRPHPVHSRPVGSSVQTRMQGWRRPSWILFASFSEWTGEDSQRQQKAISERLMAAPATSPVWPP